MCDCGHCPACRGNYAAPPAREWKPGDVAIVDGSPHRWVGMVDRRGRLNGFNSLGQGYSDRDPSSARPLVVIDTDDRAQVARLAAAYERETHAELLDFAQTLKQARMRQALRSLLAPPKCTAALNIEGRHIDCDRGEGHDDAFVHGNATAEAIWQGRVS